MPAAHRLADVEGVLITPRDTVPVLWRLLLAKQCCHRTRHVALFHQGCRRNGDWFVSIHHAAVFYQGCR